MSFDYSFSFGATTPPSFSYGDALDEASFVLPLGRGSHHGHSRSSSHASMYSQQSSPESVDTQLTTPARSPIRQHGPLLLPKIRSQDQQLQSPPKRFKKTPTSKPAFRPAHTRSYTNPESISFAAQDTFPSHTPSMTTLCSPISLPLNERRASSADIVDNQTLGKYGFPTYRQMPTYIPSSTASQTETFMPASYYQVQAPIQRTPSPLHNTTFVDQVSMSPLTVHNTSSLQTYLTSPNPAPALVRQLNIHIRDTNVKHFWWDIRQIRPWTSFNISTISHIPGLHALLNISLPSSSFPTPPRTSSAPETEAELASIYNTFYGAKLNAALQLSLGQRHLAMRATPTTSKTSSADATFTSNYTDDTSALIYGRGLGRVVGLVKSFDRWNTGMRVEGNHRKVEYLRGLSHIHRLMRDNGCRYGFIVTEIELVVVRNGTDCTPNFGYVEIQTVQLAAHDEPGVQSRCGLEGVGFEKEKENGDEEEEEEEEEEEKEPRMTALLALWYLHMLARDEPLPGQVGWRSEIGAPAEGTRRKCLVKDSWIPEPQLAEKREAKRARGWVWPEEPVGRKELGKRGVRYGAC